MLKRAILNNLVDWKNTDCSNCKYIRKSSFIKGCFEELKDSKEKQDKNSQK